MLLYFLEIILALSVKNLTPRLRTKTILFQWNICFRITNVVFIFINNEHHRCLVDTDIITYSNKPTRIGLETTIICFLNLVLRKGLEPLRIVHQFLRLICLPIPASEYFWTSMSELNRHSLDGNEGFYH